jgi:hypothetical protein
VPQTTIARPRASSGRPAGCLQTAAELTLQSETEIGGSVPGIPPLIPVAPEMVYQVIESVLFPFFVRHSMPNRISQPICTKCWRRRKVTSPIGFLEDLKEILSVGTLAYMAGHPVHLVLD